MIDFPAPSPTSKSPHPYVGQFLRLPGQSERVVVTKAVESADRLTTTLEVTNKRLAMDLGVIQRYSVLESVYGVSVIDCATDMEVWFERCGSSHVVVDGVMYFGQVPGSLRRAHVECARLNAEAVKPEVKNPEGHT